MARMAQPDLPQPDAQWWLRLAQRLNIKDQVEQFFHDATTPHNVLDRVAEVDGDMQYILFVLVRHWIPIVLHNGREALPTRSGLLVGIGADPRGRGHAPA